MKLKIVMPSGLDATNIKFDETKGEVSMDLVFYGDGRKSAAGGVVQALDDSGEVLFSGLLEINGQTARATVLDRTKPVVPLIERKKKTK